MRIDGSTILLTGASSGIGAELAPLLAERGATVGIAARREAELSAVLSRCQQHTPGSRKWIVDLGDPAAAEGFVDDALATFGHLDCLVNNAAMAKRKLVTEHGPDDVDLVLRTNFVSPVRMSIRALSHMLERGTGTIVNIGSAGGRFGIAHESIYCASKFALSGWTEVAAMDLSSSGIEVKLVQPGAIDTEIWKQAPGDVPALPVPAMTSAFDAAVGIVEAIEGSEFESFVPPAIRTRVDARNADIDGWISLMGALGAQQLAHQ